MNDAFAALQRIKASKVRAVAGVLPSTALVPSAPVAPRPVANTLPPARVPAPRVPPPSSTIDATSAIARRRESSKEVITEARRISSLPTWDYAEMLERCKPGGDLDLTPLFRTPAGTMSLKPVQNLALYWAKQQRGLIAPLAVGAGKCVAGETEVYDVSRGRRVRVDEIPEYLVVTSMDEATGKLHPRAATAFPSGSKPCVRLSLAGGQSLVLSTDHPVFTHRGWVHAEQVRSDDLVATPRFYPPPTTPLDVTNDEVIAVSYFLANGGCTGGITFTDDDPVLVEEFTDLVDRLSVPDKRHKKVGVREIDPRGKNATYLAVRGMKPFVKKWGLDHLSKDKRVPAEFYGLSDAQVALFVNRFWASDGHINERVGSLELVLASEGLIDDIQFLLLRLGVASRKKYKRATFVHKGERKYKDAWRLTVTGVAPVEKFFARVGPIVGKESLSASVLASVRARVANTNVDVVPFGYAQCSDMLNEMGVPANVGTSKVTGPLRRTAIRRGMGVTQGQYVGRDTFARFCSEYTYSGKYAWLATNDLMWEKVAEVAPVGVREVYDLSVDETHNFVANGVVLHNTLLSLLVAPALGAQRPVLLVPPTMQIPLRREMERLAVHFKVPKNIFILPYSQLSIPKSSHLLEEIKPDLIIADEAHMLKNPDSARVRRFLRLFRNFPNTRLVAMSGTFTSKSLKDYGHLCELALRDGSPLPIEEAELLAWSNVLDSGSQPQERDWSIFAAFSDLRHIDDHTRRKDEARVVFRERFNATPGVVATREASVACSLNFFERELHPPDAVATALRDLHRTWTRPDGEEMDSALSLWRLGMQISQGFYLRWVWPNGQVDWEWMEARSGWHREVRYFLQRNVPGIDSPFLVWSAVHRGVLTDPTIVQAFHRWEAQKHKPQPPTETVWIDDFLVQNALSWLKAHPKGLLWHNDIAIENALRAAGVPTYGRGTVPPIDGSKCGMALSVRVHGTGLNLQHHHHENLILSFPSSGKTMEQLVGRTHRQGQPEDEVNVYYYGHTTDASAAVLQAREDARYIETTQGSPQKLVYGVWA